MNETGFFSYRFMPRGSYNHKKGLAETVSWFVCADQRKHYLIEKWKINFIKKYKSKEPWKYLTIHQTLTDLYDTDTTIKGIIDNMIQIDERIPHSAAIHWKNRKPSYMYKRPIWN